MARTETRAQNLASIKKATGSFSAMASRMDAAAAHLVETLAAAGGISNNEARKVAAFYIKHKLVRPDFAIGRYKVTHGGYFDRDAVRRALEMAA